MSLVEQFGKASEKGKVEQITTSIYKFIEEGQVCIGIVKDIRPFTEGTFDTEVSQYVLETDEGLVSMVLGSATDKKIAGQKVNGKLVRITYRGKTHLEDGRSVNDFAVEVAS